MAAMEASIVYSMPESHAHCKGSIIHVLYSATKSRINWQDTYTLTSLRRGRKNYSNVHDY